MNNVEQCCDGHNFAIAYQDNGVFHVCVLDNKGEVQDRIPVSEILAIEETKKSLPITGFWEPLITSVFIPDDDLFICMYHRIQRKQFHFTYSYERKELTSEVIVTEITDCTPLNFPIKSFYSPVTGDCYTFYR